MAYIEFDKISKKFGKTAVLKDVSFMMEKGEACGFSGRNGSGKTMIFKILAGLVLPDSGAVFYNGENLTKGRKFISGAGLLLETPGFIPHYSGLKNLSVLNDLGGGKASKEEMRALMEKFGLDPKNKKPVRAYSMGMRQKLGIVQAVMGSPELIILDEPMNGLDEKSIPPVRDYLSELNKKGATILIASHIKEDIETLCSRIFNISGKSAEEINANIQ